MAEEKIDYSDKFFNADDMSVLNELLHTIRGISAVSGGGMLAIPVEDSTSE